MREFRQLETNVIHESPTNPRRSFSETSLDELTTSVRRHGVLQPILVRPNGDGFVLIAGARRLRAAKLAGCAMVPARVLDLDDAAADEATIIENLHREDIHPLDEGVSYQRLVSAGRPIEDIAAALGKSKGYVYQRISLTRLVPKVQDLLARDVLPLIYALKIAVVPAEQQEEALAQCFRPLFRDEEARRDQLEPLAQLTAWIEKTVRLNPRSEDTQILLPALVDQVVSAEQERDASVLALSTLHFHTDKADPKPILAKSWKPAEGKQRCAHARPGVIVLGEGQGTFLHVCIAKKHCDKHWGRPKDAAPRRTEDEADHADARRQQEEAWAKQRAEQERWRKELRPRAVRLLAERTAKLTWSPMLLRLLLEEIRPDELFREVLGKPDRIAVKHYPQALAIAVALRHGWQRDGLFVFAKRLGVKVTSKDLADSPVPPPSDPKSPSATTERPRKTLKRP
ncbi:MAG: ParB/RepB/Spo0J family partition protein [Acidobacteria bacterium]|nr:ParB/RepB/Spo0J family partition protein [Acidobacteriota bacterium]